jgi:hypothetical protein
VSTRRGPDHQKEEATRSLWDLDGQHAPRKYRNKGRARGRDKKLTRRELEDAQIQTENDCDE